MGMVKIVDPRGWNFDRNIVVEVPVSSRGLRGADRSGFLKIASHVFVDAIDNMQIKKGEHPVHVITVGATEAWGPNRNGDGFKEAHCKKHHRTFEKFARWYRNHKNKDPAKSYGRIEKSAYSQNMRRIELLCMLNSTKEAAERNGGLVADTEMEKLARGDDLAVSMACRVPYDVCSSCQNKARTREEYCTSDMCKYGGCRSNLTKVASDGHILHVDNPNPTFFDNSHVIRPADRTAYGCTADWFTKAASANEFIPGAEMAEHLGVTAPMGVLLFQDQLPTWNLSVDGQVKLAYGFADLEQRGSFISGEQARAVDPALQDPLAPEMFDVLGTPGTEKSAEALGALADEKVILPFRDFARWIGKSADDAAAAQQILPAVFSRMIERGDLEYQIANNPFAVSTKTASVQQRALAADLAANCGFSQDALRSRSMLSGLRQHAEPNLRDVWKIEKTAFDQAGAEDLAVSYGLYKLAALHRIAAFDKNFSLTGRLALGQNRVP
jgi:hypothetical protein